jgi:hypothetical protein
MTEISTLILKAFYLEADLTLASCPMQLRPYLASVRRHRNKNYPYVN